MPFECIFHLLILERCLNIHPHILPSQPRSKIHHSENFKLLRYWYNLFATSINFTQTRQNLILVRSAFQTSYQSGTFKCARARCKTCPVIYNVENISGLKRSIKITDHFNCNSANVIYCIICTLCKKRYTSAKQGDD